MNRHSIALMAFALFLSSCIKEPITNEKPEGSACEESDYCQSGLQCVENICRRVCSQNSDCKNMDVCINNACYQNTDDLECATDNNCIAPSPCQSLEGAKCIGGRCQYQDLPEGASCSDGNICTIDDKCTASGQCQGVPAICDAPPPAACTNNDSILITYAPIGTCQTKDNLGCVYSYTESHCDNCSAECLNFCMDVHCEDSTGSCLGMMCDPKSTADPPCSLQHKLPGTACARDENNLTNLDGYCDQGKCYECTSDAHCKDQHQWNECFSVSCINHHCISTPKDPDTHPACGNRCVIDTRYGYGDCSEDGLSCSASGDFCNGFRCDPLGIDCLNFCQDDTQCTTGYFCNTKNRCQDKNTPDVLPAGQFCDGNSECLSDVCLTVTSHKECAAICSSSEECTNGLICAPINPRQANSIKICQPAAQAPCQECENDYDCQEYGAVCEQFNGQKVCLGPCDSSDSCPVGFECRSYTESQNNRSIKQCLPTIGTCSCTSEHHGASRQCVNRQAGIGSCFGQETCNGVSAQWEGCNAQIPMAESCDGLDNNCDGLTDTTPEGVTLTIPCGYGYENSPVRPENCSGVRYCQNGRFTDCTAPKPAASDSICDGIDNDCDGAIDEDALGTNYHCRSCGDICPPGGYKTGVYSWGCSNHTCQEWICQWPYFDVDGQPNNGCEVIDNHRLSGATRLHNYNVANAINLGIIDSSGKSEIHLCNGLLPRDNRKNYYSSALTDISSLEGNDYYYFQYTDGLFALLNLKLRVVLKVSTYSEKSSVKVCISDRLADLNSAPIFSTCQTVDMSTAMSGKKVVTFDHNADSSFFNKAGYFYIKLENVKPTYGRQNFSGKYHLQLIEESATNDISGSSPACN